LWGGREREWFFILVFWGFFIMDIKQTERIRNAPAGPPERGLEWKNKRLEKKKNGGHKEGKAIMYVLYRPALLRIIIKRSGNNKIIKPE
jgi:hypothetical protein